MNRLKAGWPKGKKKSSKGAPSSLASYGPGAPPLQFQRSSQALPPLIEDCLAWLEAHRVWEVEGIFRISGDFHEIKALLRKYAKGKKVKLDDETTGLRAHTVACLFKTYLRELPIPLLTFELYKPFLSAIGVPDEKARLELIRTTMAILPPANKALLTRLLALMRKVADHADINKMHAQNLAIVFAPCLLRPENDDLMAALMDGGVSQALLSTMVTHYSYFFIEKGDKSETAKQLTGEYKDFYRTLRKGTLRLAASMVEEKKLLQRLKEGEDYQSEGEGGRENGGAAAGEGGGDGGDVEGGLASMSSEVRRFAAKAEPRRRAATTATTPEAAAQGKPLPAPPRPARPPPVTKLLPAPDAQPLRPQPPIPQPAAAAAAEDDDDHLSPREPQEPPQQPQQPPTPFEGEDHVKATATAAAAKAEEPAVMDLKTTRKLPKRAGAKEGDGGDKEERERERERERKAKQISMSWNPSHVRRELEASGGGAKGEQGRLLYAELEGSGKELLRSHSTQIASIRRRLKQSSAELASSSDSDDDDDDEKKKNDDRTRARSLCRSTPAAKVAPAASDSDSDHSTQRLSSSHRVRSVRSRLQSDSDSDSDSSASSSDEPKPAKRSNENKKSRDDDDDNDEDDASENSSGDEVKVVTTKQTTTYLTPEQMVKLVRQQRAQQRKELLAKKKNDKQQQQQQPKKKKKKRGSGSDSDSSSEADSSSASSSGSDSDEGDVRSKRKSAKAVSHRHPMGKSMPTRPSASPTPARLAASMPSPHEERKERTPSGGSSSSSSSSEDDADDAEVVLAWSEKMAEGDLGYFERLVDGGSNPTASADLAALAKDVDLVSLDHFQ